MARKPAVFNWSGGKDSTLALHQVLAESEFEVRYLLTTINDSLDRITMHGVRTDLLLQQVKSLGIPLIQLRIPESPDMETYESEFALQLHKLKAEGIQYSIFGDIFLEDLRKYRERQLAPFGLTAVFPLWNRNTSALVKEFLNLGYLSIVVCAQTELENLCGRVLDQHFLSDLPNGVDPCGENGEYHTFVFDGPIFKNAVEFKLGVKVFKSYPNPAKTDAVSKFCFIDVIPI